MSSDNLTVEFNNLVSIFNTNNSNLTTKFNNYLTHLYNNVKVIDNEKSFSEDDQRNMSETFLQQLNTYINQGNSNIYNIENFNKNLLEEIIDLHRSSEEKKNIINSLGEKMTNAEDFFNIIMNKHQGAIGNLDISEYNRNLVIFKNLIISTIIMVSIYLYFKKS